MCACVTRKALAPSLMAAALSLTLLAGCGSAPAADSQAVEEPEEEVTEVVNLSGGDEESQDGDEAADSGETDAGPSDGAIDEASGTIEAGSFTFDIPDYWAGRVSVSMSDLDGASPTASVHLAGNPDAELARLTLMPGDEPQAAGDIGSYLAGSVASGNDTHVEVWANNWPWLAAHQAEGGTIGLSVSEDELEELVDLSTGGELALDDVELSGTEGVGSENYDYVSSEVVPTVAFG